MKSLVGFEKEFEIISKNLIADKLNNSVLISGNKGIGKYFFIISFTKLEPKEPVPPVINMVLLRK